MKNTTRENWVFTALLWAVSALLLFTFVAAIEVAGVEERIEFLKTLVEKERSINNGQSTEDFVTYFGRHRNNFANLLCFWGFAKI